MRKFLLYIVTFLVPTLLFSQSPCPWVNDNFPEVTHFDGNNSPVINQVPWANDWTIQSGPTSSSNTGPASDFSGIGSYVYTEATQTFNTLFVFQTECFNVDDPWNSGLELSFWYHMYGISMGELEVFIIELDTINGDTTELISIAGDQGNLWQLAVFDLDSIGVSGDFLIEFHGTTGPSYQSDIAIDNIRIGDPIVVTYGCTDTTATNFDPLAMINDSSCVYPPCPGIQNIQSSITCGGPVNQAFVDISWDPTITPSCEVIKVHKGTNPNNLFTQPWNPWNGQNFYDYIDATPVTPPNYFFVIETLDGSTDTVVVPIPNCGVGCTDTLANNYNPFANIDDGSCITTNLTACGDTITQKVYVSITPDNFSNWETTWEIVSNDSSAIILASEGNQNLYGVAGVPVVTEYCIPMGVEFIFNLYDSYGDGLAGATTGGSVNGSALVTDACGDTIYVLNASSVPNGVNFGYAVSSDPYTLDECPPENPLVGCKDPSYLEYNSLAETNDPSFCLTLAIPGCLDTTAFNYDPNANTMDRITNCDYTLQLFDGGNDGWNNSYIGIVQDGNPIGAFTCMGQPINFTLYNVSAISHIEITFYEVFDIQGTSTDITQCGFKFIDGDGNIVYQKGDNPWLNPITPGVTYTTTLDCGNYCEPVIMGCTDILAYNYDSIPNTLDSSCVYQPGCTDPLFIEYWTQGFVADVDDGSCSVPTILGCTDSTAFNYNPLANLDNQGCIPKTFGCTDSTMYNYDANANTDDGSCTPFVYGCTDASAFNYDSLANTNDGSCIAVVFGCIDSTMWNYNSLANTDNGTCQPFVYGCTDSTAFNYDPLANTDNGTCYPILSGCTDSTALNYNPLANTNDNSCIAFIYGCTDATAFNYNSLANTDDGSCIPIMTGCMDSTMYNYDSTANTAGTCIPFTYGCTDPTMFNYDPLANTNDGSCTPYVYGCTDPTMFNYDSIANTNNGSCIPISFGCTDSTAFNYDPLANTDNGTCDSIVYGCTNPSAMNYNSNANVDDTTCVAYIYGCTDSTMFNYNPLANTDNGTCQAFVYGCTDVLASNYTPLANTNDNSCYYNPGCTDANFLQFYTQGFTADYDNGSCLDSVLYGCMDNTMFNYNSNANIDNGSCIPFIYGCLDSTMFNYDPSANTDNGTCVAFIYGCTDSTASNYNPIANTENGTCYYAPGCTDPNFIQFWNQGFTADYDDGSCLDSVVYGCMDPTQFNYNSAANLADGSCIPFIYGCMDSTMWNYNPAANTDNGTCVAFIYGCTDATAANYNPLANTLDGSCYYNPGCTDPLYLQFWTQGFTADYDNGSCVDLAVYGCMNPISFNYDSLANIDDGSCVGVVLGCMDDGIVIDYDGDGLPALNYNPLANTEDGSCITVVYGCTDNSMFNYDPNANVDNGSCVPFIFGCMDSTMFNYDPTANTDNGSCIPFIYGCMDNTMFNYDPSANTNQISATDISNPCIPFIYGCMDSTAFNYDPTANTDNGTCIATVYGCTDEFDFQGYLYTTYPNYIPGFSTVMVSNYDPSANTDDGSCLYYDQNTVTGVGTPYWLNDTCYAWVVYEVDPYCLNNTWDNFCQSQYDYCEYGTPLGLEDMTRDQILVYPNPTRDKINIKSKNEVDVDVYDLLGNHLIHTEKAKEVDMMNLPSGVYNLRITFRGMIINHKVIKQ